MADTKILVDGLVFPEGPRWRGHKLWFSDIYGHWVRTCDATGHIVNELEIPAPSNPSGLGFLPNGDLLVVSVADRQVLRRGADGLTVHGDLTSLVENRTNDMVVDKRGYAYVGNPGFRFLSAESEPKLADLCMVAPDGAASIVADGLAFINGMVITADGKTLVVGESMGGRFTAFDIRDDGTLVNRRIWAQFDDIGFSTNLGDGRVVPDGCCMDSEGAIWVASPGLDEVLRVREGGEIVQRVRGSQPTYACALGGEDGKTLFVLTAPSHFPAQTVEAQQGRIETVKVAVAGAGLP